VARRGSSGISIAARRAWAFYAALAAGETI
jgi:hypothetical protein